MDNKMKDAGNVSTGALYGLGVIGAGFYFLQNATTVAMWLTGILKAIFWPAFLVYQALKFFGI